MIPYNFIQQGDCRVILPTLEAGSIQSCVTHPPYWQAHGENELGGETHQEDYNTHLVDALHGVHRVLKSDGDLWMLIDSTDVVPALVADGWMLSYAISYRNEWLLHFGPRKDQNPLPEFDLREEPFDDEPVVGFEHYHCWSGELVRQCLEVSTKAGDVVLDPFCGVGKTGRIALKRGRHFVGIELDMMRYIAALNYTQLVF